MSNNQKNGRNKIDFRSLWEQGRIQKNTRITYDVVWNVILFFIIIGVIGLFFAGGVGAGYFASLVKDEPVRSQADMEDDIYNYSQTSTMLFTDETEIGDVSSDLYREVVELDQVSDYLRNAVIATEDEYFEEHQGVVPKAVMRAVVQEVTNSSVKTGGSTLTQQLVKNQILTNEVSFERKAKEMLIALRIERFFEKEEILEAYLNIVPFGRNANGQNVAGVQTAAQGIFGVNAGELSLAQSAFIAGLPQSPFGYTPFNNDGTIKDEAGLEPGIDRMHEVLERMLEAEYITKAEYDEAMAFSLNDETLADAKPTAISKYPAINQEVQSRARSLIKDYLMKENGHTQEDLEDDEELAREYDELAEREMSSGGYQIHTTLDKEVYDAMQDVKDSYTSSNWPWGKETIYDENGEPTGKTAPIPLQLGSVIIENSTGKIHGFIGGYDFEEENLNHATQARRSNGSTMKPLLVYGPSFDMGAAQPGSVIPDVPYYYSGGKEVRNFSRSHKGFVSARYALAQSYNVPAVKQYSEILDKNPVKNYLNKMDIKDTLYENDYTNPSMALGALTDGITVEQNVNAFATFANMGKFVDAYMIEKIETKDGETVYQHEAEETEVFSPQASYLTLDVMRDVLDYGTGSRVRGLLADRGVDWAGKTGTSQATKDSWFVATNPNVSVGMWTGFSEGNMQNMNYNQRTQGLWADVVNAVTELRPELMAPSNDFENPGGLVTSSYCATSGMLPSDLCSSAGLVDSDIFDADYAPSKADDSLIGGDFVSVKGKLVIAGPDTPREFVKDGGGVTLSPEWLEEEGLTSSEELRALIPNSSRWSNVTLPSSSSIGSTVSSIDNDSKAPSAPGSVSASGSKINWNASGSNDVVGYRIYRASEPGGSYSLLGSTVNTSYSFSGDGVYAVRAVDYFGQSSSLSSSVTVGNPGAPKPEPDPEPAPEPEPEPEEDTNDSSNENSSEGNNGNNNENTNDSNADESNESTEENNDPANDNNQGGESDDSEGNSDDGSNDTPPEEDSDNGNTDESSGDETTENEE
ncbi:penicillin-binding protein [Halobacillus kuroshimensis]|uniref:Penicillin-binding protein n=1 Tax=Halobacillus kuroshimensis TaxID=302481 RepID=A0ABS3E034_9BACI|nr:transglycosylase domain-containing protein [Halobacillus kuroshimensis]MBN8236955.1 penicillin-binding protein [Halobacillus kuroshimensis]